MEAGQPETAEGECAWVLAYGDQGRPSRNGRHTSRRNRRPRGTDSARVCRGVGQRRVGMMYLSLAALGYVCWLVVALDRASGREIIHRLHTAWVDAFLRGDEAGCERIMDEIRWRRDGL
jgi:hypothetical protein